MSDPQLVRLEFTHEFGEREEQEAEDRGYLNFSVAVLEDGKRIPIVFYDPVRLKQDLEEEIKFGKSCIAEVGLIVVPSVSRENMQKAVNQLLQEGFFDELQ